MSFSQTHPPNERKQQKRLLCNADRKQLSNQRQNGNITSNAAVLLSKDQINKVIIYLSIAFKYRQIGCVLALHSCHVPSFLYYIPLDIGYKFLQRYNGHTLLLLYIFASQASFIQQFS